MNSALSYVVNYCLQNPLEAAHIALDILGMLPVVGIIADGLNAALYFAQGDIANGVLSAVALIPMAGVVAVAGKFLSKYGDNILRGVLKYGDEVIEGIAKYGDEVAEGIMKYGDEASDAMKRCTNGNCFVAGTLILTADGYKNIEDIKVGDTVIATDPETGETAEKKVVETFVRESNVLVHITVNGETIITTPTHPFYVPQLGWTDAADLRAGDMLVLVNGEYAIIEQIEHEILEEPVTVYNFEVEDFHTYHVSEHGVLVHNANYKGDTSPITGEDWRSYFESTYGADNVEWLTAPKADAGLHEFDIAPYGEFSRRANVGDELSGHEILQNAWLEANGIATRGSGFSLRNPAIALREDSFHKAITSAQRMLGLNKVNLIGTSWLDNIAINAEIMINAGVPIEYVEELISSAVEFATKNGF